MDETSTLKTKISEKLLERALKSEAFPKATEASLEFIRNFAANFRVCNSVDGRAQELLLN